MNRIEEKKKTEKENKKRVESFFGQRRPCSDDICSALELLFFTTSRLITYSKRVCAVFCIFLLRSDSPFFFSESRNRMYYMYYGSKKKDEERVAVLIEVSL